MFRSDFKCNDQMQIMFAVDTSSNVGGNYIREMRSFLRSFIRSFDIKSGGARFSFATFDDAPKLKILFDAYETESDLIKIISKISTSGGKTRRIDLLLDLAASVFDEEDDDSARKVLIVATTNPDSSIRLSDRITLQDKVNRVKENGAEIFYVGVGESTDEARIVSSSPKEKHVINSLNSGTLRKSSTMAAQAVCDSILP